MSAAVTSEDVQKIAGLARMTLSDDEVTTATRDLSRVLNHFSTIQSIDTAHVMDVANLYARANISREDVAQPDQLCTAADIMDRASETVGQYVKVPAVF